jgi:hypothetical protein
MAAPHRILERRSVRRQTLLALTVLALAADAASASVVNIISRKDNSMFSESDNSNALGSLYSGETAMGDFRRALMNFDVAGSVPAGSTISSVTLALRCTMAHASIVTMSLKRMSADWGEGTSNEPDPGGGGAPATDGDVTWNYPFFNESSPWITPGGDFTSVISSSVAVGSSGATYTWPTTSQFVADVQDMLDHPSANFGWILIGAETTSASAKRFASRENTTQAWWPTLSVTYTVPAPGAPALLAPAMVMFARRRRR